MSDTFSQSDLGTMRAAIASGVSRVRFADGREVTYQNVADLIRAYDRATQEVSVNGTGATGRTTALGFTRD